MSCTVVFGDFRCGTGSGSALTVVGTTRLPLSKHYRLPVVLLPVVLHFARWYGLACCNKCVASGFARPSAKTPLEKHWQASPILGGGGIPVCSSSKSKIGQ